MPAFADTLRLATWHAELTRDGPGLLLRDIRSGDDPQIAAAIAVIGRTAPDVLLLTGFDHDPGGATLAAFAEALADAGAPYPHRFALPSNAGLPTDLDLDGDGRRGTARDAQGYGRFRGHGAMVLLSRLPIAEDDARNFSDLLWREAPWAERPVDDDGAAFPSMEADAVQRLSSTGHWVVPLALAEGQALDVLAFAATPPVFDGPEDRNGLRNAGEIGLWQALLDGEIGPTPEPPFVILGRANLDPADGEGLRDAITALLDDPRLQDPRPSSAGGRDAAEAGHSGDPALDTAEWGGRAGNLRVDYVLPSADLTVEGAGVDWPAGPAEIARAASRSRLVWVDVTLP